jgi:dipeptidyl aminopeptidase/acylaminoacyl peptidase
VLRNLALLAAVLAAAPSFAQTDPAAAFGARESVASIALSPDGTKLAFVAPHGPKGGALYFSDVSGTGKPLRTLIASGDPEHFGRCSWVSNIRVICSVYSLRSSSGELRGGSRLVAVDADGSNLKVVSRRESIRDVYEAYYGGDVIDWFPGRDNAVMLTRLVAQTANAQAQVVGGGFEGLSVETVDTTSLKTDRIIRPVKSAIEFISDGKGEVRIMGVFPSGVAYSYDNRYIDYRFRKKGSTDWEMFGRFVRLTQEGFNPYAVDPAEDAVFGFQKKDGRQALYKRALDGSNREVLVFARPDVDVDGLVRLGRRGRIIGVTFATEKRQSAYFDPVLAKLATGLSKALPATPLINFSGASDDEQRLLIWAGADNDPGRYYLYDKATKQLKPLLLDRPELASTKLAIVKPVQVRASDGTLVPGYLTLPPGSDGKRLPAIVMPHGGPGARDEWGFDWLSQYYANRGFAVLQPNFRGSSGYGDAWFEKNGFQSWKTAIGDVTDAGRWLVSEGIADPAKLAIVGWSYGGYAALQSAVIEPDLFKAVIAIAPVTDLAQFRSQLKENSGDDIARDYIGAGPHIVEGSPAQHAERIKVPVLLAHGDLDQNVDIAASRLMNDRLKAARKPVEFLVYPGLQHSLIDSKARPDLLRRSDAFLRASMGMK